MRPLLFILTLLFLSCSSSRPTTEQLAAADYGDPPTEHIDLIKNWLRETYGDPQTAGIRDLQYGAPVKGYQMPSALESGGPKYGYEVEVTFSRPATEGRRTVRQRVMVHALIRNNQVVSYKEQTQ